MIVLIDNDGGGIFHFLPVASEGDDFVTHVATPHGLDFAHAAALYGVGYERAADVDAFRAALAARSRPSPARSSCLRTDRERERRPAPPRLGRGRRLRPDRH